VAVGAQPHVALAVEVGLVRAVVLAAVELDNDPLVAPQAVDRPGPDGRVALWQLNAAADQEPAKAPLELALGRPPAGDVGVQRGAQFGAARVATAQRELRVGGAQVVMELGLGQRAKERALLISGGEVEEGAGDGGGGKPAVLGGVAGAQPPEDVKLQALDRAMPWHRQLHHRGRGGNEAPAPGRRAVTEERTLARGQQAGDEVPFLGEKSRRHRCVHAAVDAVQPARAQRATNRRAAYARGEQLLAGQNPVLSGGDRANRVG
jgi:hypothetical protein